MCTLPCSGAKRGKIMLKKYINIVEAANKGCPIATYDIDVNLKNRQKAIDAYHRKAKKPGTPD